MKKMKNITNIAGLLYEHDLQKKVTGENSKNPGTEFITGTVSIATDDACLNIVPVHFTYVTATTSKGKPNATFATLSNIIDGNYPMVMTVGADGAAKVRINSSIGLNEFYSNRNGEEELVSVKRNEGGFIHIDNTPLPTDKFQRCGFDCDILITNVRHVDADEERQTPEKAIVKGALFNDYNKTLIPVEFSVLKPGAISYFESLEASSKNPTFTQVKGYQVNTSVERQVVEKGAFGDSVKTVKSSNKDWVIDWAAVEPHLWDDESTLTAAEVNEAIKTREVMLATMKQRNAEYQASRAAKPAAASTAPSVNGETFDF